MGVVIRQVSRMFQMPLLLCYLLFSKCLKSVLWRGGGTEEKQSWLGGGNHKNSLNLEFEPSANLQLALKGWSPALIN